MYVLGVDIGTTGTKAMLINEDGNVVKSAYSGYTLINERMGFVEQDADDWWKAFVMTVRECVADVEDKHNILAVSMSTQGGSMVPVDGKGTPLSNAMVWMDFRGREQCRQLIEQKGENFYYRKTGWRLNTGLNLVKIKWIKDVRQDLFNSVILEGINDEVHIKSTIASLAVRNWIEQKKLTAFTINFLAVDKASGIPAMPFLEASKAMARGVGYAGEGDVLTAALVGALASVYRDVSFTEMFCPDWEGNSIFLSHMGEMNINLAADKPRLIEMDFPYTDADNPAVAYGRYREGKAVFVNLAPAVNNTYTFIVSEIEMLGVDGQDRMKDSIHGWFRPNRPVGDFLKEYSLAGGTHHSAIVYGDVADEMVKLGKIMNWKVVCI